MDIKYNNKINNIFQNIAFDRSQKLSRATNHENVIKYWHTGKFIYEILQEEKDRADYGVYLIKSLSSKLKFEIGKGFSERRLKDMRKLYMMFPEIESINQKMGWTQIKILMRIKNEEKRNFYINLCLKEKLTTRDLELKIKDSLYEQCINC